MASGADKVIIMVFAGTLVGILIVLGIGGSLWVAGMGNWTGALRIIMLYATLILAIGGCAWLDLKAIKLSRLWRLTIASFFLLVALVFTWWFALDAEDLSGFPLRVLLIALNWGAIGALLVAFLQDSHKWALLYLGLVIGAVLHAMERAIVDFWTLYIAIAVPILALVDVYVFPPEAQLRTLIGAWRHWRQTRRMNARDCLK
jgi:hypothetical protein